ncbi:MAG TPA: ribonuclease III [Cyanophyceae cyanobacterium]
MSKFPKFRNPALLRHALTHRSYANEHPGEEDNERLEFLGDAILNFLSGEFLYHRYPQMNEGQLTPLRSALVDAKQLAKFAKELGIDKEIRLGKGATLERGWNNPSLLSSAFEAMVGAYFLDSGIESVRKFVEPLFTSVVDSIVVDDRTISSEANVNFKSRFQQWVLANRGTDPQRFNPKYVTIEERGSDHAKIFVVKVFVDGEECGCGEGSSKKAAEQSAAKDALKNWA